MESVSRGNLRPHWWADEPPLRIGNGAATVASSYAQHHARGLFFEALFHLVPQSTYDLTGSDALALDEAQSAAFDAVERRIGLPVDFWDRLTEDPDYQRATLAIDSFVADWQKTYNLHDEWIAWHARETITAAAAVRNMQVPSGVSGWEGVTGLTYDGPLSMELTTPPDLHDGLLDSIALHSFDPDTLDIEWQTEGTAVGRLVMVDDLKQPSTTLMNGQEWEDDGLIGEFDPRTEKPLVAYKRLLPQLQQRLKSALERIEREDCELNGAVPPNAYGNITHYGWLVAFQVLGHGYTKIAKAEMQENGSNVRKAVLNVAALIGLTLRLAPVGRPRAS